MIEIITKKKDYRCYKANEKNMHFNVPQQVCFSFYALFGAIYKHGRFQYMVQ